MDTWVAASVGAADSVAVAAIAVDTAAELMEAVIAAGHIPVVMQAEAGTAAHTQDGVPLLRDRGRGKAAKEPRGMLPLVGTDSQEITAR